MTMRWHIHRAGRPRSWVRGSFTFYDLVDENDECVAWIREHIDRTPRTCIAHISGNHHTPVFPSLREAKEYVIATLVAERLDE